MKQHSLPQTPPEWLHEIALAMADAREAIPFVWVTGHKMTEADLFHLAPRVCLKFRGRKASEREVERVTEIALANVVVNSDPATADHDLPNRPFLAFALCYLASHLALDLIDEQEADQILIYCEEQLDDEGSAAES